LKQQKAGNQQDGKNNTGNGCGTRCSQARANEGYIRVDQGRGWSIQSQGGSIENESAPAHPAIVRDT
jgi:hypothetical protein